MDSGDLSDLQNDSLIRQVVFDWPFMPRRMPYVSDVYLGKEQVTAVIVCHEAR